MLAVKINDPYTEKYLANLARAQGTSRQNIVRAMINKQIEDAEDYQAAVAAAADLKTGRSKVISHEELWGKLGLAD